ncbi:DUF3261 domain-containing protein [Chitinimonas sp.]|uniref:DUF3261 domain-containing protein n=1 Tax=Chitinimonas sp. TaxID=1934313 RepID=UPI002F9568C4
MQRLIVLFALLLAACATVRQPPLVLPSLQLAPGAFGQSVSLVQRLRLEQAGINRLTSRPTAPRTLDAILEIDPDRVQLAGIAFEQRVLTILWDGHKLRENRHPFLPAEIDAARVLRDVQLVYWPLESVAAALPAGWSVAEQGESRSLSYGGEARVTVTYRGRPRWVGQAEIDNKVEGYKLTIDSTVQAGS